MGGAERITQKSIEEVKKEMYQKSLTKENEQSVVVFQKKTDGKVYRVEPKMTAQTPVFVEMNQEMAMAFFGENYDFERIHSIHTHNEKARNEIYDVNNLKYPGRKTLLPPSSTDFKNWILNLKSILDHNKNINLEEISRLHIKWGVEEPEASWTININKSTEENFHKLKEVFEELASLDDSLVNLTEEKLRKIVNPKDFKKTFSPKLDHIEENQVISMLLSINEKQRSIIIRGFFVSNQDCFKKNLPKFYKMLRDFDEKDVSILENSDPNKDSDLLESFLKKTKEYGWNVACRIRN